MVDRVGQQLGNYRLIRLLGRGGFAEVYLAEHIYLNTQAAIKILHTELTQQDLQDFLQEAQTIARLKHPNIVRILDFGVDSTTGSPFPYLVMDYAPNGTLRQRHLRGSIAPLTTVVSYVKQVASALQYAHDEKLIHRDVKPENMLLGSNDEVLLSDFGIVAVAHSTSSLKTQGYAGTAHYSAPEQIAGKPRPASDQYALGIVVYEWLAGARPFSGDVSQLIYQHISTSPPPLREKVSTISRQVEHVVMKALEKDPQKRFAKVRAFANALEHASKMDASLLPSSILGPPGSAEQSLTVVSYPSPAAPKPTAGTVLSTYREHTHRIHTIVWSPDGVQIASASLDGPIHVWDIATGNKIAIHDNHSRKVNALAWSAAGIRIASANSDATVQVWEAATGDTITAYNGHVTGDRADGIKALAWSPDNTRIASTVTNSEARNACGALRVWRAATGEHTFTMYAHTFHFFDFVVWSADGSYVAARTAWRPHIAHRLGTSEDRIQVWDTVTGKPVAEIGPFFHIGAVTLSPKGTYLAAQIFSAFRADRADGGDLNDYPDGWEVQVWEIATKSIILTYRGHSSWISALAWSPDGKHIASGSKDGAIQMWDATTGNHVLTHTGHTSEVNVVAWSPDSSRIASASEDGTVQVWQAE